MLPLARRNRKSIYSLSAKGVKWWVHGLRPNSWQHTGAGRPGVTGRLEAREGPDVGSLSDVYRFSSGGLRLNVRSGSDVWGVDRPFGVGSL